MNLGYKCNGLDNVGSDQMDDSFDREDRKAQSKQDANVRGSLARA